MKAAYFDCFSGISGDMCLGALLDAGLSFSLLEEGLQKLGLSGYAFTAERVVKQGISAVKAHVDTESGGNRKPVGLAEIKGIIRKSLLPEQVKKDACSVFQKLVEAEAKVHGVSFEAAHLHETGGIDALMDVVGTVLGLHLLGVSVVYVSPLPLGGGTVQCDHGILPVPAPASLELLKGMPVFPGPVQAELVTPTGAALVSALAEEVGPIPPMTVTSTGYGAGTQNFTHPNVLRVVIGDLAENRPSDSFNQESVAVIEATIDDMNPEFFTSLGHSLFSAGALDYYFTPVYMKKQRPATKVTILSPVGGADKIAAQILRETTTLGCRIRNERRLVADRNFMRVETPYGEVEVKFSLNTKTISPEYESCAEIAGISGVPVKAVYDAAKAKAWELLQLP